MGDMTRHRDYGLVSTRHGQSSELSRFPQIVYFVMDMAQEIRGSEFLRLGKLVASFKDQGCCDYGKIGYDGTRS